MMQLTVTFDLSEELERRLLAETPDLEAEVEEVFAVEMFRRGLLSHTELTKLLGLDRHETDALLQRYRVESGSPSMDDLEADRETLARVLGEPR